MIGHASTIFGAWDGYETIDKATAQGWHIYSAWGEKGWDAGDWPLVIVGARRHRGAFQSLYVVEGDVFIEDHATLEEAHRHLDGVVLFHWQHGVTGPPEAERYTPATMPADWRGPFRWHRLCKPGEPVCTDCRKAAAS